MSASCRFTVSFPHPAAPRRGQRRSVGCPGTWNTPLRYYIPRKGINAIGTGQGQPGRSAGAREVRSTTGWESHRVSRGVTGNVGNLPRFPLRTARVLGGTTMKLRMAIGMAAAVILVARMAQVVRSRWHGASGDRPQPVSATALPAPGQARATLSVPEMWCSGCTAASGLALKRLRGVQAVAPRLETRQIIVNYDPTLVHSTDLVSAMASAGFTAILEGCRR
jgi:copper chaperone CopZ